MRLDKPVGVVLLLWPTWWALWLASSGLPSWSMLAYMTSGVVVMRSLGCVVNDCCDRRYDGFVERTKNRPIVQGRISLYQAWTCAFVLACMALWIVLHFNLLVIQLSCVGLALTLVYPLMKRFFSCPQLFLGLTFAWGIPMAYAAIQSQVPTDAWSLYVLAALWILIYDTQYAMVDREDDIKIGVRSSARLFGENDRMILTGLTVLMLVLWLVFAYYLELNLLFFALWLIMCAHQWIQCRWVWTREKTLCFRAFLSNQWWGGIVWLALVLGLS